MPVSDLEYSSTTRWQGDYWHDRNLEALGKIQNIAKHYGHTPIQVALAWLLSNKTVTSVLSCVDFADQVDQNITALEISLSDDELAECNEIYEAMLPVGWITQEGADVTAYGIPGEFAH